MHTHMHTCTHAHMPMYTCTYTHAHAQVMLRPTGWTYSKALASGAIPKPWAENNGTTRVCIYMHIHACAHGHAYMRMHMYAWAGVRRALLGAFVLLGAA